MRDEHIMQFSEVNNLYTSDLRQGEDDEEPELIDLEDDANGDDRNRNLEPEESLVGENQEPVGIHENHVLHDHNFAKAPRDRPKNVNNTHSDRSIKVAATNSNPIESLSSSVDIPSRIGVNYISNPSEATNEENVAQLQGLNHPLENVGYELINFNRLDTATSHGGNTILSGELRPLIPLVQDICANGLEKVQEQEVCLPGIPGVGSGQFTLSSSSSSLSLVPPSASPTSATVSTVRSTAKESKTQRPLMLKPKPVLSSSVLNINVPGGYFVQVQRYIYAQPICRVCLLAKSDMVYLFEDMSITENGVIKNPKGPSNSSNRYNLLAAMKTLLDIDVGSFI